MRPDEPVKVRASRSLPSAEGGRTMPDAEPDVLALLGTVSAEARRIVRLEVARIRFRVHRKLRRAAFATVLGLAGLVVLVLALIQFVQGLAGALSALAGGVTWAGPLLSGSLVLALLGLGAWISRRRWHAAWVERLESKLGRREEDRRDDA